MKARRVLVFPCVAALMLSLGSVHGQTSQSILDPGNAFELIGQVLNTTATQSLQYGYVSALNGVSRISSQSGQVSEANALLTFYNDTTTNQVINNGPIRVIDRTGTGAIYLDQAAGNDFGSPDGFRKGAVVQAYTLRHQVIIDTSSGYFTAIFRNTITQVRSFQIDGATYYLGHPGQVYQVTFVGRLTTQGPPSAHIAGFATGRMLAVVPGS